MLGLEMLGFVSLEKTLRRSGAGVSLSRALSVRLHRTGLVSSLKHVGGISLEFFIQLNVIRDKETLS